MLFDCDFFPVRKITFRWFMLLTSNGFGASLDYKLGVFRRMDIESVLRVIVGNGDFILVRLLVLVYRH
jgi:hypothetical protein